MSEKQCKLCQSICSFSTASNLVQRKYGATALCPFSVDPEMDLPCIFAVALKFLLEEKGPIDLKKVMEDLD